MRRVLLAATLASLPALAWAQTSGSSAPPATHARTTHPVHTVAIAPPTDAQTSGADTLAGEDALLGEPSPPPAAALAPTPASTSEAAQQTNAGTEPAPAGVAAPGITLSESGATEQSPSAQTTPPSAHAPPANAHAAATAPSGVAAPGVSANGGAAHAAPARAAIEPANDLERAFVNAAHQANARIAFRRTFLASQVALATVSADANAAPREIRLGPGGEACLIFTSDARATQIMGPSAPRQLMTGRQALERLRGAPLVIININMDPYLTLDAAGIEAFLGADAPAAPASAGPSQ